MAILLLDNNRFKGKEHQIACLYRIMLQSDVKYVRVLEVLDTTKTYAYSEFLFKLGLRL